MAYFICEKQGRCCPHEFYDSIEQAISDSEDGVPCDHLIEVTPVRHGYWIERVHDDGYGEYVLFHCSECDTPNANKRNYCDHCGAKMDGGKQNEQS